MKFIAYVHLACVVVVLSSCAVSPSERLAGRKMPVAPLAQINDAAEVRFSADKKYETANGVPLRGDPLICTDGKVFRVNQDDSAPNKIAVKAGDELAVTSVIVWTNTGFQKTCGPFVRFAPEKGATYIVVNERIGGKGVSWLWTGMAFQTCAVSVYKEMGDGFSRVPTQKIEPGMCRMPEASQDFLPNYGVIRN